MCYGIWVSVMELANKVANQGDNVMVGRILGEQALGFYGRAYQLFALPAQVIGEAFHSVYFPAIASIQNDGGAVSTICEERSESLYFGITNYGGCFCRFRSHGVGFR